MKEEKVLIIGAGRSGIAAARFLLEQEAEVCLYDDEPEQTLSHFKNASLTHTRLRCAFNPEEFSYEPTLVVLSPGVPLQHRLVLEAKERHLPILNEIEIALRSKKNLKIIGITGTNGKSTATVMMESILKEAGLSVQAGGNLGTPLCDLLGKENFDYLVLELSSFQLETLKEIELDCAIILNVTPDHLDRYPSMDAYLKAKLAIFDLAKADALRLLNENLSFLSLPKAHYFSAKEWGLYEWAFLSAFTTTAHDRENALAVAKVARFLGLSDEAILRGLQNFKPLDFRCQFIAQKAGINFINDSKGTTVVAVEKALASIEGPVHLLLGGYDKGEDFSSLKQVAHVAGFYVYGQATEKIMAELKDPRAQKQPTLREAFNAALSKAAPGSTVLLSPGCASYDQFKDYIERGQLFNTLVHNIS